MRIIQLLPTISFGDAIGNDVLTIQKILVEQGYETGIYAENIDSRLPLGLAKKTEYLPSISHDDVLIYHLSTGTELNYSLSKLSCKKTIVYHNITPPMYFNGYSSGAMENCYEGYKGARYLADKVEYCIADSEYNKQELIRMGYNCPIDVCPILIPFEDYNREPDHGIICKYSNDGWTNLVFVGRIVPNKKHEDIIRAFYYYHNYFNPNSRLFLVGSNSGVELYQKSLEYYSKILGLSNYVIFTGHIKFDAILAYYHIADSFICMSEHEGFCVPLLEAMHFGIPIIAYRSSAIPETLGEGGLILDDKNPEIIAATIDRIIQDQILRNTILQKQQEQLQRYRYESVKERFLYCLGRMLENKEVV